MKSQFIWIMLLSTCGLSHGQPQTPARMSPAQAKRFALAAIPARSKRLPDFQLELESTNAYPGLYMFNAIWEGLPEGSVEIGFYAVDPITGAVWNAVMECMQLKTRQLRQLQARWTRHSGLTKAQLHKLQANGPQCTTT
jgi:hypothetical protein